MIFFSYTQWYPGSNVAFWRNFTHKKFNHKQTRIFAPLSLRRVKHMRPHVQTLLTINLQAITYLINLDPLPMTRVPNSHRPLPTASTKWQNNSTSWTRICQADFWSPSLGILIREVRNMGDSGDIKRAETWGTQAIEVEAISPPIMGFVRMIGRIWYFQKVWMDGRFMWAR